jgi:hypothetical protein
MVMPLIAGAGAGLRKLHATTPLPRHLETSSVDLAGSCPGCPSPQSCGSDQAHVLD